ncbi:MAG TPA: 3D domain-containing protein [Gaiellaceae bacterium]|nr:3D domain-containing protein [Gaiellaceae bacterium]
MSGGRTRSALSLAGVAAALVLVSGAAAGSPGAGYRARAHRLTVQAQKLDTRTHRALLDLYALESQLARARTRLASLQSRSAELRARHDALTQELAAARATLAVSQQQLGQHLRSLYEQGTVDPLAVVLGAQSLDDAISKLDALGRMADQDRKVVAVTLLARARLSRARVTLAREQRRLSTALGAARQAAGDLSAARSQRLAYVSSLHTKERLAHAQIRSMLATARAVEAKSEQIAAASAAPRSSGDPAPSSAPEPSAEPVPASSGERTLRVSSTGYSLPGHTASGLPVGWGIVAVDPTVIPLGTRMTVPGYGEAVAADVGSAVKGADIDLWFPTLAQARAWGRRTVVITLH